MLASLGRTVVARRKIVLLIAVVFVVVAAIFGGSVSKALSVGGLENSGAESSTAAADLERIFNQGNINLVLLVTATKGNVDSPDVTQRALALTDELGRERGVAGAASYWTIGRPPPLRSTDGRQGLVLARLSGDDDTQQRRVEDISKRFNRTGAIIDVGVTGRAEVLSQLRLQSEKDLKLAELISAPLTLLLLILVFGSLVSAGLPLVVGAFGVVGTFFVLRVIASITQVTVFALNLTTALGLSLAIDYSLIIVARFREELRAGHEPHAAVVRTVRTAGRTVLVSALTVAAALSALFVFPLTYLRSFAYAGIAVIVLAAVGAVVVLPAVLAMLGTKIDKGTLFHHRVPAEGRGFWHRTATTVMRHPVLIGGAVVAFLLFLGTPFLGVKLGLPDDRVLPASATSRRAADAIRTNFASNEGAAIAVVATDAGDVAARNDEIGAYADRLSQLPGVARVDAAAGSWIHGFKVAGPSATSARFNAASATWFSVVPTVEPFSEAAESLVKEIRAGPTPFPIEVGGLSAQLVDTKAVVVQRLPWAGLIVALVTFTVLFLLFGSLLLPLKAILLNVLSLTASFGAMVFIFQEGHLSHRLAFTATDYVEALTPILMFCVAFGLSMDYEVFLLSRVQEEYLRTGDNRSAVAYGLERTGRVVTAAAGILAVVFGSFITSKVSITKLVGLGLTVAVVVDATLVRALLVPAFMRLAGRANWWAPKPLRWLHQRIGLSELESGGTDGTGPPGPPGPPPAAEPMPVPAGTP